MFCSGPMSVLCCVPLSTVGLACPAVLGVQGIMLCIASVFVIIYPWVYTLHHYNIAHYTLNSQQCREHAELANESGNEGLPQGLSQLI